MEPLELINADELYYKPLSHPEMLIDGLLSAGLAILSGDSKIGKSWLVLWLFLKIAKGEPVWGIPIRKADVIYLALEDRDWRLQDRLQLLTDDPPVNLFFGFSCGVIGRELESQIRGILLEKPEVGIIFIDTFQKVRENISSKLNAYAKDYQDLGALKKIADEHGICIFLVHHTRKERDGSNVFHDITGFAGIAGVADTLMVLQKENHFSEDAILSITGRDIEERTLHLKMIKNIWEVTEEIKMNSPGKREVPELIYRIAEYFISHEEFIGTMTNFLKALSVTDIKPNAASRYLSKYFNSVLKPLGMHYESHRSTEGRIIGIWRDNDDIDDNDGYDGPEGSGRISSIDRKSDDYLTKFMTMRTGNDGQLSFPLKPSLSSIPSSSQISVSEGEWKSIDTSIVNNPFSE